MSSTPAIFSDDFNTPQAANSGTLVGGTWNPITSTRELLALAPSDGSNIGGGKLNLVNVSNTPVEIIYASPNPIVITYDISAGASIVLSGFNITTGSAIDIEFSLTITDNGLGGGTISHGLVGNTVTWPISEFINTLALDPTNVVSFQLDIFNDSDIVPLNATAESIDFVFICVARDTRILMADGTEKLIQDIKRGDCIAEDINAKKLSCVARVLHTKLPGAAPVALMKMPAHSLGFNQPHSETIITTSHPILFNDSRYRAKALRNINGIKYYNRKDTCAADILPVNSDGSYSLYNIQFEHDGYFVANGLSVDSVPVFSTSTPLPKVYYFNDTLYENPIQVVKPKLKKKL